MVLKVYRKAGFPLRAKVPTDMNFLQSFTQLSMIAEREHDNLALEVGVPHLVCKKVHAEVNCDSVAFEDLLVLVLDEIDEVNEAP